MWSVFLLIYLQPLLASVVKDVVNSCGPTEFACGDGGCVNAKLVCDGSRDCADGWDEAKCETGGPPKGNCVLPQFPEHGTYTTSIPNGVPGEAYEFLAINVTCRQGYGVDGSRSVSCYNGRWREKMPKCVVQPLLASVVKDVVNSCGPTEFACGDGGCVNAKLVCDGSRDCADGWDEAKCETGGPPKGNCVLPQFPEHGTYTTSIPNGVPGEAYEFLAINVTCRQGYGVDGSRSVSCYNGRWREKMPKCVVQPLLASVVKDVVNSCGPTEFACGDGGCVNAKLVCDGSRDCADGWDEAKCETGGPPKGNCVLPQFPEHGTYTTSIPNGVPGEAYEFLAINVTCRQGYGVDGSRSVSCYNGRWREKMPKCVVQPLLASVVKDVVNSCGPTEFACGDGGCVNAKLVCDGSRDCADGWDEAKCETGGPPKGNCVLPQFPEHGTYTTSIPNGVPGEAYEFLAINVTCRQGYGVDGSRSVSCYNGRWREKMPKCVALCHLPPHPSVEYLCLVNTDGVDSIKNCTEYEPDGTIVSPRCRTPNYYSPTSLRFMHCIGGNWDHIALCSPECGTVTPDGSELSIGGENSKQGEVPWHAGIYVKTKKPYIQICGGSLISSSIVISAAHCFYDNEVGRQPASKYAVAVGKIYRPWNNPQEDEHAQRSDVKEIRLPVRFQGSQTNFQDDIAVVIVSIAFEFKTFIRPVCVDFDIHFERRQLEAGKSGKVASWGLTSENGNASQILQVIELPYVNVETCIADSPPGFREYITSDKICAGVRDGTKALCKGDTGGGLAFPESDKGTPRYYLRGVVSTSPNNDNLCNANTYTSFTQVIKHEHFIKQFWSTNL